MYNVLHSTYDCINKIVMAIFCGCTIAVFIINNIYTVKFGCAYTPQICKENIGVPWLHSLITKCVTFIPKGCCLFHSNPKVRVTTPPFSLVSGALNVPLMISCYCSTSFSSIVPTLVENSDFLNILVIINCRGALPYISYVRQGPFSSFWSRFTNHN